MAMIPKFKLLNHQGPAGSAEHPLTVRFSQEFDLNGANIDSIQKIKWDFYGTNIHTAEWDNASGNITYTGNATDANVHWGLDGIYDSENILNKKLRLNHDTDIGANEYSPIPAIPGLIDFYPTVTELSLGGWFRLDFAENGTDFDSGNTVTNQCFFSMGYSQFSHTNINVDHYHESIVFAVVYDSTGNKLHLLTGRNDNNCYNESYDVEFIDGQWVHVFLTIGAAGSGVKLYLNGIPVITSNIGNPLDSENVLNMPILFGAVATESDLGPTDDNGNLVELVEENSSGNLNLVNTKWWLDGGLTQAAVYYNYLTNLEVQTLYNSGVPYDLSNESDKRYIPGLYAYYRTEGSSSKPLWDYYGRFNMIAGDNGRASTGDAKVSAREIYDWEPCFWYFYDDNLPIYLTPTCTITYVEGEQEVEETWPTTSLPEGQAVSVQTSPTATLTALVGSKAEVNTPEGFSAEEWDASILVRKDSQIGRVYEPLQRGGAGQVLKVTNDGEHLEFSEEETGPPGGGDILTDDAWQASGDLVIGSGLSEAVVLTKGDEKNVLTVSGQSLVWAEPGLTEIADESITEPKLDILNETDHDALLSWDNTNSRMKWTMNPTVESVLVRHDMFGISIMLSADEDAYGNNADARLVYVLHGAPSWTMGVDDSNDDNFLFCRNAVNLSPTTAIIGLDEYGISVKTQGKYGYTPTTASSPDTLIFDSNTGELNTRLTNGYIYMNLPGTEIVRSILGLKDGQEILIMNISLTGRLMFDGSSSDLELNFAGTSYNNLELITGSYQVAKFIARGRVAVCTYATGRFT